MLHQKEKPMLFLQATHTCCSKNVLTNGLASQQYNFYHGARCGYCERGTGVMRKETDSWSPPKFSGENRDWNENAHKLASNHLSFGRRTTFKNTIWHFFFYLFTLPTQTETVYLQFFVWDLLLSFSGLHQVMDQSWRFLQQLYTNAELLSIAYISFQAFSNSRITSPRLYPIFRLYKINNENPQRRRPTHCSPSWTSHK